MGFCFCFLGRFLWVKFLDYHLNAAVGYSENNIRFIQGGRNITTSSVLVSKKTTLISFGKIILDGLVLLYTMSFQKRERDIELERARERQRIIDLTTYLSHIFISLISTGHNYDVYFISHIS